MDKYYIISNSDGDTTVNEIAKEDLLKRLDPDENYYGNRDILKEMPQETDTNYWGDSMLIIKGTIVSPRPVTKITEFEID